MDRVVPGGEPQRVLQEVLASSEDFYLNSSVPCYGLPPEWDGFRTLGEGILQTGTGRHAGDGRCEESWADRFETLQLVHGQYGETQRACLISETCNLPDSSMQTLSEVLEEFMPISFDIDSRRASTLQISVNGKHLSCASLIVGPVLVARHDMGHHVLTLRARHWPSIERMRLVRIVDFSSYFAGHRARILS